jgi:hypothetical protein
MATPKKADAPAYDNDTRYEVTLSRVVQHEGFVFRPDGAPILSGTLLNAFPDAVIEAKPLPPAADLPAPPAQVHESAEGTVTVVNAA